MDPQPTHDFPTALAREMARARLSQAELAKRAGVPQSSVSTWLAGKREPSLAAFVAIADALGVKLDRLRA